MVDLGSCARVELGGYSSGVSCSTGLYSHSDVPLSEF